MTRKPKAPPPVDTPGGVSVSLAKRRYGGFTRGQLIFVGVMGVIGLWGLNLGRPAAPTILPTAAVLPTSAPALVATDAVALAAATSTQPAPTATITETSTQPAPATATITETPMPTDTAIPTLVPTIAVQVVPSPTFLGRETTEFGDVLPVFPVETMYAGTGGAKLRTCPQRTCEAAASLLTGDAVIVDGMIDGEEVEQGNKLWYRTQNNGQALYVFSGVTGMVPPPGAAAGGASVSPTISQPVTTGGSCPSISATCGQMTSCEQARSCLAAGNSSLDADSDGIPCESICGG